ncbi:MAG: hypothetical protein ACYDCO_19470 [Armatimonadota bacterium]
MQILAHSVVPSNPVPYLHLGYLSAGANRETSQPPGYGFITGGAMVVALLGIILFRKGISPVAKRYGRWIMLTGLIVLGLAQIPWPSRYAYPENTSQDHAYKIYHRIRQRRLPGDPIPSDLRAFAKKYGDYSTDGWNREMRIVLLPLKGKDAYAIVSAGRDGKFGTDDDIAVMEGSSWRYPGKHQATVALQALTNATAKGQ